MAEQSDADYRGNLGRYALYGEIAAGGMATVHLARLLGPVGFSRTVAIKRLHPHLAKDPEFVGMFLEEARLAARVQHPNVVSTLDVVSEDGELFLVMEYVPGESLSRLIRKTRDAGGRISPRYIVGMLCGALDGLHAAHEAKSEKGLPLGLVHRDVSPQNIHVGIDGVPRVLDFGIAKATNRVQETRTDQIKGKVAYMPPEQLAKGAVDRRADIYSASVMLWEALTGERLFKADDIPSLVYSIVNDVIQPPSEIVADLPAGLDEVVLKGLDRDPENRWSTAREMAEALEAIVAAAPPREIGEWVESISGDALAWRQELVQRVESESSSSMPPPMPRGDVASEAIEVSSGVRPTSSPDHEEADRSDERATLVREDARDAQASMYDPNEEPPRSVGSIAAMILAAVLLVGGGALFALRWMELASEQAADGQARGADSAEPAIGIGGSQRGTSGAVTLPRLTTPSGSPAYARPSSSRDDCDNPFMIDSHGIRHPKAACFGGRK